MFGTGCNQWQKLISTSARVCKVLRRLRKNVESQRRRSPAQVHNNSNLVHGSEWLHQIHNCHRRQHRWGNNEDCEWISVKNKRCTSQFNFAIPAERHLSGRSKGEGWRTRYNHYERSVKLSFVTFGLLRGLGTLINSGLLCSVSDYVPLDSLNFSWRLA